MSEQQRTATLGFDVLGIALFGLAIFLSASIVMSMMRGIAPEAANISTQAIAGLVQAVGGAASLCFALGLAWIGARQWFGGTDLPKARQAAGFAGLALGLAFLLGALGEEGGSLGTSVRASAGVALGTLLGVIVSGGALWWAFFPTAGKRDLWNSQNLGQEQVLSAASVTKPGWGVSQEEAQALLPESPEEDPFEIPFELPRLYPPDARLEGRIPEGAWPIDVHESAQTKASELQAQPIQGWAPQAEAGGQQSAGGDLAFVESGEEVVEQELERSVPQAPELRGELPSGELNRKEVLGPASLPMASWERGSETDENLPVEVAATLAVEATADLEDRVVTPVETIQIAEEGCEEVEVCGEEEYEELVRRAGDLILERNRVSVSLLQREFELDFKQATEVLDRLQELGLIGPYIGGQRRDILMTPATWRALTSA